MFDPLPHNLTDKVVGPETKTPQMRDRYRCSTQIFLSGGVHPQQDTSHSQTALGTAFRSARKVPTIPPAPSLVPALITRLAASL